MNETYLKIAAAVAPAVVLAFIMIRKDRRREPTGWLLRAAGLGVLVVPVVLLLDHIGLLPDFATDTFSGAILASFVDAAIPEEALKFAALWLLVRRCRHFDEMFDGVVYAVCIGMGFAAAENIIYLFGADDEWIFVGVARALLAVPMHYVFAVIMGSFFALGWFDARKRALYMSVALLLPIAVHGVYDTLCFSADLDENYSFFVLLAFLLGFRYIRRYVKSLTRTMLKLDGYEP